jgi:elongation factor P
MASIQATELRKGTVVIMDGAPYSVVSFEHRTPGNKRGFVQVKLRSLRDGTQREQKLSATEFLERAHMDFREVDYLYADGDHFVFMDVENYEQTSISAEGVGDAAPWLVEGMRLQIQVLNGEPIGVVLPKTVEIEVREAEPVVKGQTAAKSNKPAVLANGVTVQVPPFIAVGDRVKVDPGEQRYIERVK